jgi:hypothetical protein
MLKKILSIAVFATVLAGGIAKAEMLCGSGTGETQAIALQNANADLLLKINAFTANCALNQGTIDTGEEGSGGGGGGGELPNGGGWEWTACQTVTCEALPLAHMEAVMGILD